MKARVKATGDIIDVKEVTKYDSNYNPLVYYKAENGFSHQEEHLDFKDLTQGKVDVKEKSLPKDEPDYWEKLKHQYAGMALQGILSNPEQIALYDIDCVGLAVRTVDLLINKLKEEEK